MARQRGFLTGTHKAGVFAGRTACALIISIVCLLAVGNHAEGAPSGSLGNRKAAQGSRGRPHDSRDATPEREEEGKKTAPRLDTENARSVNSIAGGGVPCLQEPICRPIELVIVVDTSGSMGDEGSALCADINQVIADLSFEGITVFDTLLGITETPGGNFSCLATDVVSLVGGDVPGTLATCPFPNGDSAYESWGPATAILAERLDWSEGAIRLIVPLSDEGPCNGSFPDGCNDPGDDRDSITNAIAVANSNSVIVSPITGTSSDSCTDSLAADIASETGGIMFHSQNPQVDLAGAITNIVTEACMKVSLCDDENPCTEDDVCIEGMCEGAWIPGCVPCISDGDCGEAEACTEPFCDSTGVCSTRPGFDDAIHCCDPDTGELQLLDDRDVCTDDVCDPASGAVAHVAAPETPCDDGLPCTVMDACDDFGICIGVDVETVPCSFDTDCFEMLCDDQTGYCDCVEEPTLCLVPMPGQLPSEDCYEVGEVVVVNIELGVGTRTIAGGQFSVMYDPAVLDFLSASTGDAVDLNSPFSQEILEVVDEFAGEILYVVLVDVDKRCNMDGIKCFTNDDCSEELGPQTCEFITGTTGPAIMATFRFQALAPCDASDICFLSENPRNTLLTDDTGSRVDYVPCCAEGINVAADSPPMLGCPSSVSVNAQPGELSAEVVWEAPAAAGGCGGEVEFTCGPKVDIRDIPLDQLVYNGGLFPVGVAEFECVATDQCGQFTRCNWNVQVNDANSVEIDVQLSPQISRGPLRRCVEFEFFRDCFQETIKEAMVLTFGRPLNLPGFSRQVGFKIPAGQYGCVTARDPWHTLWSVADMEVMDRQYVARFIGDPVQGGNWLVGGNLDGSAVIDIIDHARWAVQQGQQLDPDTLSCAPGPTTVNWHADINGDGIVDAFDQEIIFRHLLKNDKISCCSIETGALRYTPIMEISIEELNRMGMGDLSSADMNSDGMLNMLDVELVRQGFEPVRKIRTSR